VEENVSADPDRIIVYEVRDKLSNWAAGVLEKSASVAPVGGREGATAYRQWRCQREPVGLGQPTASNARSSPATSRAWRRHPEAGVGTSSWQRNEEHCARRYLDGDGTTYARPVASGASRVAGTDEDRCQRRGALRGSNVQRGAGYPGGLPRAENFFRSGNLDQGPLDQPLLDREAFGSGLGDQSLGRIAVPRSGSNRKSFR